jgi:hypothetical protein
MFYKTAHITTAKHCAHSPFRDFHLSAISGLHLSAFPALETKRLAVHAYPELRTFGLRIQEQHE